MFRPTIYGLFINGPAFCAFGTICIAMQSTLHSNAIIIALLCKLLRNGPFLKKEGLNPFVLKPQPCSYLFFFRNMLLVITDGSSSL